MSTLGERIKNSREKLGLLQSQLAKLIGVKSAGVISNWENDINKPDADKIVKLCDVLDVSLSYLLNYFGETDNDFSLIEKDMVKKYRTLDEHGKTVVDCLLSEEYKRMINDRSIEDSDIEQEDQFTIISFYPIGASAGTGLWLFDDIECMTIQIPYTDESRRADFALPVHGDSMEPKYHDGDLLLVRQQPAIDIGEIGIFVLNDEGYVKKQGEHGLISLNDSYDDINISEFDSIYCKGKVVGFIPAEEAKKYLP